MSRLIIKNLPKDLTEDKFRAHFAKKGEVTDAKLMRTSSGQSRRFGFIGYRSNKVAEDALNHFNGTFINTSKIIVEKAIPYGSENIPRGWSKYTEGTSAHARLTGANKQTASKSEFQVEETDAFRKQKEKLIEHINQLKADEQDPKLKEYLDVMTSRSKGQTWTNDDLATLKSYTDSKLSQDQDTQVMKSTAAAIHDSDDELYDELPSIKKDQSTTKNIDNNDEDIGDDDDNNKEDTEMVDNDDIPERAKQIMEQENKKSDDISLIEDTGRLFLRNLPYSCSEEDLRETFSKYGPLSEVHMPIAKDTKQPKGYAYILFLLPEHAVNAYKELDMKEFQGRLLHILPAKEKPVSKEEEIYGINGSKLSAVKKEKEQKRKNLAGNDFNWNSLYMSSDAIAESIADRLGVAKSDILNAEADNVAVRLALAETQIISETKEFFETHGIVLDTFGKKERSETVILVKNIPYGTSEEELRGLFGKFGELGRVLIPPAKTMAVVEFLEPSEARRAFQSLAYRRFKDTLIYLEKAPMGIFKDKFDLSSSDAKKTNAKTIDNSSADILQLKSSANNDDEDLSAVATLFVKNLNFETTAEGLRKVFASIEGYRSSRINVKPNPKNPSKPLSMGFGFVEFNNKKNAQKALDAMQGYKLDGHALQLKFSHHEANNKKQIKTEKMDTTKLIVRNVPFEATAKDLRELFSAYGQLKSLRLPKKFNGGHRGFAFLDFMTKQEAKNVYEHMSSIHLYGRHLVLEWAEEDEGVDALREKTGKHYAKEESHGGRINKRQKVDLDDKDDMDAMSD
ncbi:uncharacterized protein BX664DRAFT_293484 [Halteromyces radiatus]|uniref:uncharacterized protein n=1 Tax=Halteromyces radiatus TaxID=101107 RepID=UPI0022208952|nr:uncharacterized protein BX664DRAFT_293484 [Halteromyces radiatus]KAI8097768.1 hypothetical protein BX664DRAFT_293484 [Halteromyces radiatus]